MEKMTKLEKIMETLEKNILKFVIVINYFSVFCIGIGTTLIIEYGFNLDFILLIILAIILFVCTFMKIKEDLIEDCSN